jgi:hypothetical protein
MARENIVDPELKQVKGSEDSFRGVRAFGDGLAGEVVSARLQGYSINDLQYLDVAVDSSGNLLTSGGGGGGGGAVTIADGADVAQGARLDATYSGTGNATVISLLKALRELQLEEATRLDDVGGGVSYVGKAIPGTATSAGSWQVKRLTEAAGDVVVEYADGNNAYDNIWDNRASLSYS